MPSAKIYTNGDPLETFFVNEEGNFLPNVMRAVLEIDAGETKNKLTLTCAQLESFVSEKGFTALSAKLDSETRNIMTETLVFEGVEVHDLSKYEGFNKEVGA